MLSCARIDYAHFDAEGSVERLMYKDECIKTTRLFRRECAYPIVLGPGSLLILAVHDLDLPLYPRKVDAPQPPDAGWAGRARVVHELRKR